MIPIQLPLGVRLRDDATFANYYPGANAAALGALVGRVESTLGGRPPRIGARLVEWFRDDARDHAAIAGMLQTFKPKVRP